MTVTGAQGFTSTDTYKITVSDASATPVADAGPDQTGAVPTSTVTLDGTGSKFASTFSWAQTAGDPVVLKNATTANPTFVVPTATTSQSYTFALTIKDVNGTPSTDSVTVSTDPDDVTVDSAQYKRGGLEWRVRGGAQYCSANNLVSVYWNKPDAHAGPAGHHHPDGHPGRVRLRLPAQEHAGSPARHHRRHRHGEDRSGR